MRTAPSFARRALAVILPVLALVALVLIGRRATTAAPLPTASTPDANCDVSPESFQDDGGSKDSESPSAVQTSGLLQLPDGGVVVDLNSATEDDLRKLPGVGATRARKILELRARLGRFKSVDDLARIKGFGRAILKRLRPLTRVGI